MARTKPLPISGIAKYIEREAKNMRRCAPLVRAGDADGVHDMRVSSRRLRVALREARPLLDKEMLEPLQQTVNAVTESLGHSREIDVMVLMLEEYLKDAYGPWKMTVEHAIEELRALRVEAQQECLAALEHLDKQRFDQPLKAMLDALRGHDAEHLHDTGDALTRRLEELRKGYRDWRETDEDDDLHRVRIAVKKLRYATEFYAPSYNGHMSEVIDELRHAQELLGDWHDAQMLCDALRRIEKHAPYRAVQGFPLVIEAFQTYSDAQVKSFISWARSFFDKPRRKALKEYIHAA